MGIFKTPCVLPVSKTTVKSILGACIALAITQPAAAKCEYVINNNWGAGFTAAIKVTNDTGATLNGWSVNWEYANGDRITNLWNANLSGSNPYTATSLGWNSKVEPGQSQEFGFQGTANGSPEIPTITGSICVGDDQTTEPSPTPTPPPTPVPTATPTAVPTATPTATPTVVPTATPTAVPTATPTAEPTPTPAVTPTPPSNAISCAISNSNVWGSGYQLDVKVTNNGAPINSWSVTLGFDEAPNRSGGWNASFASSGNTIIASNIGWNGQLATGGSTSFGIQGSHDGSFNLPLCNGAGTQTTPTPTNVPTPTATPTGEPTPTATPTTTPTPTDRPTGLYSLADFPIGVAVSAGNENRNFLSLPEKQKTIAEHFSELTAGNIMKMSYLHPSENTYTFDQADAMVNWAKSNGINIHGHTFIWHSSYQIPSWMTNYSGDFKAMLDKHVTTIASHFADDVVSWDVVNEAIDENQADCYRNSLFYQKLGSAYLADAFIAAKAADPDAKLYYNDYDTEGGNAAKFSCMLTIVDDLLAKGVPIDGVGFQMHVQVDWPNASTIQNAFQAIVDRGLMVKITEIDIPVNNPWASTPFPQHTSFTDTAAALQKQRYKSIVAAYMNAVPQALRGGITVWGLWDGDSWLMNLSSRQGADDWPLLFGGPANGPYQAKPAFYGVAEALTE